MQPIVASLCSTAIVALSGSWPLMRTWLADICSLPVVSRGRLGAAFRGRNLWDDFVQLFWRDNFRGGSDRPFGGCHKIYNIAPARIGGTVIVVDVECLALFLTFDEILECIDITIVKIAGVKFSGFLVDQRCG